MAKAGTSHCVEHQTQRAPKSHTGNVPYTLAHLAVVEPLQQALGLKKLTSAMVWGSLAPDLPMVFGLDELSIACHHKTWGLLGVAPTAAVAGYLAWRDLAPRSARSLGVDLGTLDPRHTNAPVHTEDHISSNGGNSTAVTALPSATSPPCNTSTARLSDATKWWLTATAAAMLHVGMDAFTHDDGQAACLMPVLTREVRGHTVAMWAQVGTSAIGLAMLAKHVRQINPEQSWQQTWTQQREAWIFTLTSAAVAGIVRTVAAPANVRCREPKKRWALGAIVGSMTAVAAVPIAAGLYDRLKHRDAPPQRNQTSQSQTGEHTPPQTEHIAHHLVPRARTSRPRHRKQLHGNVLVHQVKRAWPKAHHTTAPRHVR